MVKTRLSIVQPKKTTASTGIVAINMLVTELLFCNITVCTLSSLTDYLSQFRLYLFLCLSFLLVLWYYLEHNFTYKTDLALVINDKSELVLSFSELSLGTGWVRQFIVFRSVKTVKSFLGLNLIIGNVCRYMNTTNKNCHFITLPTSIVCKNLLLSQF